MIDKILEFLGRYKDGFLVLFAVVGGIGAAWAHFDSSPSVFVTNYINRGWSWG